MEFRVTIEGFHGPLDLLLYLVRKDEVEVAQLSLSAVIDQYLAHVERLQSLDIDAIGDFLEVATVLIEIKSQMVLPDESVSAPEEVIESQHDLVERLLEYKEFRDLAERLAARNEAWGARRSRRALPPVTEEPTTRPIEAIEVWDLVSAFSRVMSERLAKPAEPTTIRYDDTPVHVHMQRIDKHLRSATAPVPFEELFIEGPVHRSTLVGLFLAILELVRYGHALAEQPERFGPIVVLPGPRPLPAGFGQTTLSAA
ncbi:segregation and condensation protein A [Botrimarina hoheduenensis]|uniref:Segregation and condensation protein A n=1 Tax=Botrimarina hoheduenensis TaxID=2528000 RepID=A0A5C5WCD6_9BACT|nr:segregation/condensation protein A [Botrimarina hoheduenensis]TWT47725.1 Segregation and condensation protein A [Botrimarina hoheduenensis]